MRRFSARLPQPVLVYLLAPLVLALIPAILWLSIAPAGTSGASPVWLAVPDPVVFELSPLHLVSLALIGALAIGMLTVEAAHAPFSLHLAHWVFVYVFFFAAPLVQYKIGAFPWGRLTAFDVETLLLTDLAILVWCIVWICMRALQARVLPALPLPLGPGVTGFGTWISVVLAFAATVLLVLWLGVGALLTRADDYGASLNTSTVLLLVEKVLRGIPVAAAAGALWYLRRGGVPLPVRLGLVVVALGLLLVADFPLGTARYVVGSVYLGLLLTVVGRRLRGGWPFVFLMVGGLLVIFPLLSTLRYVTSPSEILSYLGGFTLLGPSLATGDFDAYSSIGYTMEYVREGPGVTWGRQLLGVLFFFVPRGLWPDKPVGSGYTVAVEGGLSFNNISSSPIAEGFINFGWVGVVLFAVVLCWAFGVLDQTFERAASRGRDVLIFLLYPFMVGFTFFLMRGDLLSSAAFVVGFVLAFLPLTLRLPKIRLRAK